MTSSVNEYKNVFSAIKYENESIPGFSNEVMERIFLLLNVEELAKIEPVCKHWYVVISNDEKLTYEIPFTPWLTDISHVWKRIDLEQYGLKTTEVPRINKRAWTKALKPLSGRVENKMGISIMSRPEKLTLNIVLQIAKDYKVPIDFIWNQIIAEYGDIPAEQTELKFFTNSILEGTR